jgi:hypothetical protein
MAMPSLGIILDGDNSAPEMDGKVIHHVQHFKVTALHGGMESGKPSVAFIIPLEDGSFVFAETSLRLFLTAADMFKARHGDPRV